MNFSKEKQYLIITTDENKVYKYDFNNKCIIGIKGKPIKSIPPVLRSIKNEYYFNIQSLEEKLLWIALNINEYYYRSYDLSSIEKVYSAIKSHGLENDEKVKQLFRLDSSLRNIVEENLPLIMEWIASDTTEDLGSFCRNKKLQRLTEKYIPKDLLSSIINGMSEHKKRKYMESLISLFKWAYEKGLEDKVGYFLRNSVLVWYSKMYDYCTLEDDMADFFYKADLIGYTITKDNYFKQYTEVLEIYDTVKDKMVEKELKIFYDKHSNIWSFENDDFTIVLPTNVQDFVNEGQKMHNCVSSYSDTVINNNTYVIFIRRKSNPTESYITCEIDTDGCIAQYLTLFNRQPTDEKSLAFKIQLKEHIRKNW